MNRVTNIFIELHEARFGSVDQRFGSGWENLFTEHLAFFLACDLPAATALARTLDGGTEETVEGVCTQVVATDGIPDLRLEFAQGAYLYVENKFDAPLGPKQLERYLGLGRVALISRRSQSVPAEVLQNTDYIRPKDRDHFYWHDVYNSLLRADEAPKDFGGLREHFKGYMRELGLAPSALNSEWRRLFEERTDPENQIVQKDFGRLLDPVRAHLRGRGFKVQDVSDKGKQAYSPSGSLWRHLYVNPNACAQTFSKLSIALHSNQVTRDWSSRLCLTCLAPPRFRRFTRHFSTREGIWETNWYVIRPRSIGRDRLRLSLAAPLVLYLREGTDTSRSLTESALWALERLMNAVSKMADPGTLPNHGIKDDGKKPPRLMPIVDDISINSIIKKPAFVTACTKPAPSDLRQISAKNRLTWSLRMPHLHEDTCRHHATRMPSRSGVARVRWAWLSLSTGFQPVPSATRVRCLCWGVLGPAFSSAAASAGLKPAAPAPLWRAETDRLGQPAESP